MVGVRPYSSKTAGALSGFIITFSNTFRYVVRQLTKDGLTIRPSI